MFLVMYPSIAGTSKRVQFCKCVVDRLNMNSYYLKHDRKVDSYHENVLRTGQNYPPNGTNYGKKHSHQLSFF